MNPRIIMTWFIMAIYGVPTMALLALDAYQGFPRTRTQPTATLVIIGIGLGVTGLGVLMIRGEKSEEKRYQALPECMTCNTIMEDSINCGGDCVFCMAEAGDPDCIKRVAQIARRFYDIRPANSRFGIAKSPPQVPIENVARMTAETGLCEDCKRNIGIERADRVVRCSTCENTRRAI